eukprot:scaffold1705_cov63-Cylindrotheca_fusiformis.AAC.2
MKQQPEWEILDFQGELPETLEEGNVYSVRMVKQQGTVMDVPLFIRGHLVLQEELFNKFLAGEKFSPSRSKFERRTLSRVLRVVERLPS